MALAYDTGTINAANAGAVGAAMLDKIRDNLVAHAAWDLVEEYTPASVMKWKVFKCLASVSGLSNDYYAVFGLVIATGKITMTICEGYDAATHTMTKFVVSSSASNFTTTYAYDAQGRQTTGSFVLAIADPAFGAGFPRWIHWTPTSVSTKYWQIVADDRCSIAFNGAVNDYFHFGAYIWLGSVANPCPLHMLGTTGTGTPHGMTRNPAPTIAGQAAGAGYVLMLNNIGRGTSLPANSLGIAGRLDRNDKLMSDNRPVAELGIVRDFENTVGHMNGIENAGFVVGKCKGMRVGTNPPAGFAFGDAYAHNGTLWVPAEVTSGMMWDTGVAV